ncbi:MAG: Cys-tRNA(Pro) deacylase [Deferribacterales bacterium]
MAEKYPITPAIRFLKSKNVDFIPHLYEYEEKGGTKLSSKKLGVDEHIVIKTIVLEDDNKKPLIVLMHGDMEISTKNLARFLNVKTVTPCSPDTATKHTGYLVGGTSPFGTKKNLPIYAEKTIFDLDKIFINGGKRGFLIEISPSVIKDLLSPILVEVAYK